MMKKDIVLVGGRLTGHAGIVFDLVSELNKFHVCAILDQDYFGRVKEINGVPVIGGTEDIANLDLVPSSLFHVAIGDNVARLRLAQQILQAGYGLVSLIHPTAFVSRNSNLGRGCMIGAKSVVQNGVSMGDACIVNSGAIVEHDTKVGDGVHFAPRSCTGGRVHVKDCAFIGIGSTILPDVTVEKAALIGGGATVLSDVDSNETMIGYAATKFQKDHREKRTKVLVEKKELNVYQVATPDIGDQAVFIAQPTLPEYGVIEKEIRKIIEARTLSNFGDVNVRFERELATQLGVARALTVPNCTSGLMLAIKALGLNGEVIVPSFTFSATVHSLVWNGLTPVFADINPDTLNLCIADVEKKITKKTVAIFGTHTFGNPCDVDGLQSLAKTYSLYLFFDSAQALGSKYRGLSIGGFGEFECISLSGTKVITSGEGGVIASNDAELMQLIDRGRNYGAGNNYDCEFIGLNGKLSEIHAAIALGGLPLLESFVSTRNQLAQRYTENLADLPGIEFQNIVAEDVSCVANFPIVLDSSIIVRETLIGKLIENNVFTKSYFLPVHKMSAYKSIEHRAENLVETNRVADQIICLPIYAHMQEETVDKICTIIRSASGMD